jgi:hypothetical protein
LIALSCGNTVSVEFRFLEDMNMRFRVLIVGTLVLVPLGLLSAQERNLMGDSARGAAKGAVVGAIAGDAGKGAAAGAVGGALFGGMTKQPGKDTTAGQDLVGGAAKGAVIGAIAGDAGKGAAAGAVGSALFGGMRRNR